MNTALKTERKREVDFRWSIDGVKKPVVMRGTIDEELSGGIVVVSVEDPKGKFRRYHVHDRDLV